MATDASLTPAADFEVAVSGLLSSGLSASSSTTAYSDEVFDKLAKYLSQAGKQQWSLRPRTYLVLRLMNRLDSMDAFILDGLFDIALPYTYSRLPASLTPGARNAFLETQGLVMSKAGDLEVESGRHRHFSKTAETNFVVVKQLGSGYFGVVDHVRSKLSLEEYARKRTLRMRTFSKDKKALKMFENELSNLKRLSHRHLVKYVGSYTDPQYIGLLTSPVADCDLKVFLNQNPFPRNLVSLLRSFIGCLCSAVSYLHSQKCRHKDLKPANILVKNDVVLITDFGTSRNWSDRSKGTTTGESGPYTPGYAAPEVVAWEARNESSDVWSLGCVFLDIASVLKGESLRTKDLFFGDNGNGGRNPRVNSQALNLWLSKLEKAGEEDNQPIQWIRQMLEPGPRDRISSVRLLDDILGYVDEYIYYGHCCADQEEDPSSCNSSEFADDGSSADERGDDSTNATSVVSRPADRDDFSGSKLAQEIVQAEDNDPTQIRDPPRGEDQTTGSQASVNISSANIALANPEPVVTFHVGGDPQLETPTNASIPISLNHVSQQSPVDREALSTEPSEDIRQPLSRPELRAFSKTESNIVRNPFLPGYVPIPRNESAPPLAALFKTPTRARNPFSSFFDELDRSYGTQDTGDKDFEPTVPEPVQSQSGADFSDMTVDDATHDPDATLIQKSAQEVSVGTDNQLSDIYLLFDAAAKGNVADVMKYCLAGNNSSWTTYGRTVFHVAAENHQRTIMQVLIDIGCPVSFSDVSEYVFPMTSRQEIEIDASKPAHQPIIEQLDSIHNTRRESRMFNASGSHPKHAMGTVEYSAEVSRQMRQENNWKQPISSMSQPSPQAISPWDPEGQHYELTISPDPLEMHKAVSSGLYHQVLLSLSEGNDPNLRDEDSRSPLDIAINQGSIPLIKLLVQYGADPESRDKFGQDAYVSILKRFSDTDCKTIRDLFIEYRTLPEKLGKVGLIYPTSTGAPWSKFLQRIEGGNNNTTRNNYVNDNVNVNDNINEDKWLESWQIAIPARFRWFFSEITGVLEWHEWPIAIVDPYPGTSYELSVDNNIDPFIGQLHEMGSTSPRFKSPGYFKSPSHFDFLGPIATPLPSKKKRGIFGFVRK